MPLFCEENGLNALLELASGGELDGLGSLDLELFASLRVDPGTGFAMRDLKGSESDQLDELVLLDSALDRIDHGGHGAIRRCFAGFASEGFLNFFY